MLKNEDITSLSKHYIRLITGIYFLIKNEELVYIGKSVNIFGRVGSHLSDKDFDCFSFHEIKRPIIARLLEKKLIFELKPKYNREVVAPTTWDLKTLEKFYNGNIPDAVDTSNFRNINLLKG